MVINPSSSSVNFSNVSLLEMIIILICQSVLGLIPDEAPVEQGRRIVFLWPVGVGDGGMWSLVCTVTVCWTPDISYRKRQFTLPGQIT